MEKKAQDEGSKDFFKLHHSSQRIRISKDNSREKIFNVKTTSKLPRIIRMPTKYYKPIENSNKSYDDSGDSLPGSSKSEGVSKKTRKEDMIPVKLKISHIPRLKCHKDGSKESNVSSKTSRVCNNNQFIPECRNVQRVNLLINPECCPEDDASPQSVQSTRPIPTLGQIYSRINMIDSDRLNDWFMELRTPINSNMSSNGGNTMSTSSSASPTHFHQEDLQQRSTLIMETKNNSELERTYEDYGEQLLSNEELPTRDIESGYQTMSLKTSQKSKTISPKSSTKSQLLQIDESNAGINNQTYCVGLSQTAKLTRRSKIDVECITETSLLEQQPTVIICDNQASISPTVNQCTITSKSYVSSVPSQPTDADLHNTCSSNANETVVKPIPRAPVQSYTYCSSELLQRTTNFEVIEGIELSKPPSVVPDTEMRDTMSTAVVDVCNSAIANSFHSKKSKSCDTMLIKSDATLTNWSDKYKTEKSPEGTHGDYSHDMNKTYYSDSNENRERCKTCHRIKRFPSTRNKLPRAFPSWRSGGSIRRLCYRRWNYVWKKTAERCKCKMFRAMHNLARPVLWEDVDVQTNVFVYNEIGTNSAMKEQKSAAISTMFNMATFQGIRNVTDSGSKTSNKFKHVNSGPSMFPFFLDTNRKNTNVTTIDKNLSGYQFPHCQQNHCTSYSKNLNCQYEDTVDLSNYTPNKVTSTPAPIQFSNHQLQANTETNNMDAVTEKVIVCPCDTGTEDLPKNMTNRVTSMGATVRVSTQQLQTSTDICKADAAVTPNIILCHNAVTEADMRFPMFNSDSSVSIPSACDITYYRPMAGSDITHLITETRTQQALFPILRKYYSSGASSMTREKHNLGIATQTSNTSSHAATYKPPLTERTENYISDAMNDRPTMSSLSAKMEYADIAIQVHDLQVKPAEETETQMTPLKAISVVSTGVVTVTDEKDEALMSDFPPMSNVAEKENLAVQTEKAKPILVYTGANIVSISSKMLNSSFNTEDKSLGSNASVSSNSVGVGGSAVTESSVESEAQCDMSVESQAQCNTTTVSTVSTSDVSGRCDCKPGEACMISCGTSPSVNVFNFTKSTSASLLVPTDSYNETEMLLNNLIKKALTGSNVAANHVNSFEKTKNSVIRNPNLINVTTNTIKDVTLETKSIGPTASDITKLIGMNKADAEIQYLDQLEKPDSRDHVTTVGMLNRITQESPTQTEEFVKCEVPTPQKSAAMMTSYCGRPASIQVPPTSLMSIKSEVSERSGTPYRSKIGFDVDTNTNYQKHSVTENLMQTSVIQTQQKSLEVKIFRNCSCDTPKPKGIPHNGVSDQLISLSRLIGKKHTDCTVNSQMADNWINKYPSMHTSVHQTKLSNSFKYDSKHVFESIKLSDEDNRKRQSSIFPLKPDTDDHPVPYELSAFILSKDSLTDVLPNTKFIDVCNKKSETQISMNPIMIDEITSDNYVSKDVKESILQACPEICDTGTDSRTFPKKSACVLTTQCVLPPHAPCCGQLSTPLSADCVFVYGQPRCAVHKNCGHTAVQFDSRAEKEVSLKRECVTHSGGQLTSHLSLRDGSRDTSALIREVLSPKVYKALYETTKLVVSKDTKQPSVKGSDAVNNRADAEVDAAKPDVPHQKSASVFTSEIMVGFQSRHESKGSYAHCKRELQQLMKTEESHKAPSLETHEETNEECCEACVKRHLISSCRYYSNLLTKQLDRVKYNLAKHLALSIENIEQQTPPSKETCTMKPSGRIPSASQTLKHSSYFDPIRHESRCTLSPAMSLTNICKYDKAHLKSVYYTLSAIEGRLRRLKLSSPSS